MSNGTTFRQLSIDETHQLLQAGTSSGVQPAATPHSLVFVAEVFTAGPVMVEVSVDGVKLTNSWPRSLLVLPGRPSAEHCVVRGQSKVPIGFRAWPSHACSAQHVSLACFVHQGVYMLHSLCGCPCSVMMVSGLRHKYDITSSSPPTFISSTDPIGCGAQCFAMSGTGA